MTQAYLARNIVRHCCTFTVIGLTVWNTVIGIAGDLPADVRAALEKQREVLRNVYSEFSQTRSGSLNNYDYAPAPKITGNFSDGHFYRHERIPGFESYENEESFDGESYCRRQSGGPITKCLLADLSNLSPTTFLDWSYLQSAGIYVPGFIREVPRFQSAEPLVLQYLKESSATDVELVGHNVKLTMQVTDELARLQAEALKKEDEGQHKQHPTRKVVLVLDAAHGYAIAEREEWNVKNERFCKIVSDRWQHYEEPGIWLPGRCTACYFARPRLFITEVSDQTIHTVVSELDCVKFGRQDIPVALDTRVQHASESPIPVPRADEKTSRPESTLKDLDVDVINKVKAEALRNSEVMDTLSWLSDVFGARLTGSPSTEAAAEWAVKKLRSWGVDGAHVELWHGNKSGWQNERFMLRCVKPYPFAITAVPSTWSIGSKGRISGPAIRVDAHSFDDMQKRFTGQLKDAFLLIDPPLSTATSFKPHATRLTDAQLQALASGESPPRPVRIDQVMYDPTADAQWLVDQGTAAVLFVGPGDAGAISMSGRGGEARGQLPSVKVSTESYGRIVRMLEKQLPVTLEMEMENAFFDRAENPNVIAEIPGNDRAIGREVVMLGAHLDSWTFGTGATDDAAGVAVVMEAIRILKKSDAQPRRTIRIGLWTGEEQGKLGSQAYVEKHLHARREQAHVDPSDAHAEQVSVYLNLDGGTGQIRGIYTLGNRAAEPIFAEWMHAFNDPHMHTVSPLDIGGGDDLAFKVAGIPSFGFIQDPIEYESRTHHTSADVYDRLQPEDLKFNAAVLATFAWLAAQRDERMPR